VVLALRQGVVQGVEESGLRCLLQGHAPHLDIGPARQQREQLDGVFFGAEPIQARAQCGHQGGCIGVVGQRLGGVQHDALVSQHVKEALRLGNAGQRRHGPVAEVAQVTLFTVGGRGVWCEAAQGLVDRSGQRRR